MVKAKSRMIKWKRNNWDGKIKKGKERKKERKKNIEKISNKYVCMYKRKMDGDKMKKELRKEKSKMREGNV